MNECKVLTSYKGDPKKVSEVIRRDPRLTEKITAAAHEQGCGTFDIVQGGPLCHETNLFGTSEWSSAEAARTFFDTDQEIANLFRMAGIAKSQIIVQTYRYEDGVEGAFVDTQQVRRSHQLVEAGSSN